MTSPSHSFQSPKLCGNNVRLASWVLLFFLCVHIPVAASNIDTIGATPLWLIIAHCGCIILLLTNVNHTVEQSRRLLIWVFLSYLVSATIAWRVNVHIQAHLLLGVVATAYLFGNKEHLSRYGYCAMIVVSYLTLELLWLWPLSHWQAQMAFANHCSIAFCALTLSVVLHKSACREWSQVSRNLTASQKTLSHYWPLSDHSTHRHWHRGTIQPQQQAAVLFADIVNFTAWSRTLSHKQIVELLHKLYCHFDKAIAKHACYKLKTNGDEYMASTTILPTNNTPTNVEAQTAALCKAATDMLASLSQLENHYNVPLKIRIGIATGPVTAGIVGYSRPMLDIWGDTVNLASRLERHAKPNRIMVCDTTANIVRSTFKIDTLGTTDVKGLGTLRLHQLGDCIPCPAHA